MKFIIFSLLLTAVYSWEDIVDNLRFLLHRRKQRQREFIWGSRDSDNFVTAGLLIFAIPLSLLYFLHSELPLATKLGLIAIELITISVLSAGLGLFLQRTRDASHYSGWEKAGALAVAGASLVYPTFRMFYRHARSAPELTAKLALYLSIPALIGWGIAVIAPKDIITGEVLPNISILTTVLVGSVFIRITIGFLEQHFRIHPLRLLAYSRLILGAALVFILAQGII